MAVVLGTCLYGFKTHAFGVALFGMVNNINSYAHAYGFRTIAHEFFNMPIASINVTVTTQSMHRHDKICRLRTICLQTCLWLQRACL